MTAAVLGRDILQRATLKRERVHVPEWGGDVLVRELNGAETAAVMRPALEIANDRQSPETGERAIRFEALVVCYGWINEDGSQVLTPDDVDTLLQSASYSVIEQLSKAIRRLTGIESKAVEEAKKNSATTQNGASGSA